MPTRIFAITAASEMLTLDHQGRGEISFTASNTGPKSMPGRAEIVPLGSTKGDWLSLEGEQERHFATGEAHQFRVKIAAPRGAPTGKYPFRLNIISVENPDDEFTEGPSVSFELKQLVPAAPPPRRFPWWIVALACVLVLGVGLITWLLLPQKVAVPELVGMPYQDAIKSLEAAKLKLTAQNSKVTGKQKPGIVLEQSPPAKESVPIGSGVSLVVEVPPQTIVVPDVVGQPLNQAKDLLKGLASEVGGTRFTGKSLPGVIIEQNPVGGVTVPPETKMTLILEADRNLNAIRYGLFIKDGNLGWSDASNGGVAGTVGQGRKTDAFRISGFIFPVRFRIHVEQDGWHNWVAAGPGGGAYDTGNGKRLEAIEFGFPQGIPSDVKILARAHVQDVGWTPIVPVNDGTVLGTTGKGLRLEAIQIAAGSGADADEKRLQQLLANGLQAYTTGAK
jgi:hypothetical protein